MTAKSATKRKQEQRERDKLDEEERLAKLLARRLTIDLFKGTDAKLVSIMGRLQIDEPQDVIERLIRGADRLDDQALNELTAV